MPVKPGYLALAGAGTIVAIAGVKGWGLGHTFRDVVSGKKPGQQDIQLTSQITAASFYGYGTTGPVSGNPSPPTGGGKVSVNAVANMALARLSVAAIHPSWATGNQWIAWKALWLRESGWSSEAFNPSGAYGIAQALGHAKAGDSAVGPRTLAGGQKIAPGMNNAYGSDFGLSSRSARAANAGGNLQQIQWGIGYISTVYTDPVTAWQHEIANGWY
jgi:resuscitation-promoting factor RpfB